MFKWVCVLELLCSLNGFSVKFGLVLFKFGARCICTVSILCLILNFLGVFDFKLFGFVFDFEFFGFVFNLKILFV